MNAANKESLIKLAFIDQIQTFKNMHPENAVTNLVLKGPILPDEINTYATIALYPSFNPTDIPRGMELYSTREFANLHHIYSKILSLTVSDRIKFLGIRDNPTMRDKLTTRSMLQGLPIIVLSLARYQESQEEVIIMNSILGIAPETALEYLQGFAKRKLANFS